MHVYISLHVNGCLWSCQSTPFPAFQRLELFSNQSLFGLWHHMPSFAFYGVLSIFLLTFRRLSFFLQRFREVPFFLRRLVRELLDPHRSLPVVIRTRMIVEVSSSVMKLQLGVLIYGIIIYKNFYLGDLSLSLVTAGGADFSLLTEPRGHNSRRYPTPHHPEAPLRLTLLFESTWPSSCRCAGLRGFHWRCLHPAHRLPPPVGSLPVGACLPPQRPLKKSSMNMKYLPSEAEKTTGRWS